VPVCPQERRLTTRPGDFHVRPMAMLTSGKSVFLPHPVGAIAGHSVEICRRKSEVHLGQVGSLILCSGSRQPSRRLLAEGTAPLLETLTHCFTRVDVKLVVGLIEVDRIELINIFAAFRAICVRSETSQVRILPGAPAYVPSVPYGTSMETGSVCLGMDCSLLSQDLM